MARSRNSVLPTAAAEVLEGLVKGVGGKALRGEWGMGPASQCIYILIIVKSL